MKVRANRKKGNWLGRRVQRAGGPPRGVPAKSSNRCVGCGGGQDRASPSCQWRSGRRCQSLQAPPPKPSVVVIPEEMNRVTLAPCQSQSAPSGLGTEPLERSDLCQRIVCVLHAKRSGLRTDRLLNTAGDGEIQHVGNFRFRENQPDVNSSACATEIGRVFPSVAIDVGAHQSGIPLNLWRRRVQGIQRFRSLLASRAAKPESCHQDYGC